MLRRIALRDFVIVPALDLELRGGFTALTGETGAGKSILIDALQLALGQRGDAAVVREGAARAEIAAEFDLPTALLPWLVEAGFHDDPSDLADPADDAVLLLRRTIDTQGRSRAWINGSPATAQQLREAGERLLDIHGQHAWQSLTRADTVRALLDGYASVDAPTLAQAWTNWRAAHAALQEARTRQGDLERERERLAWQIAELDKLAPSADEWGELEAEHRRLGHAQAILDALQAALAAVSEDDASADARSAQAIAALEDVLPHDASLREPLEVLRSAQAQLQDAAHTLGAALRHGEVDPERFRSVDERLAAWLGLARRFRRPPEALPALLQGWRDELARLDAATDLDALEGSQAAARAALDGVAARVSAQRRAAAPRLGEAVTAAMQELGMAGGRFEVALERLAEPQRHGLETVEFRVAGHAGSTPRALAKVASGGELSRLALAIAVTTLAPGGESGAIGTLIFDEVDAGIGGTVASTVGELMRRLGRDRQVLCVTHLPQVAACADQHWVVSKASHGGRTASEMHPVDGEERVREIARMLGGADAAATSAAHARALLHAGGLAAGGPGGVGAATAEAARPDRQGEAGRPSPQPSPKGRGSRTGERNEEGKSEGEPEPEPERRSLPHGDPTGRLGTKERAR